MTEIKFNVLIAEDEQTIANGIAAILKTREEILYQRS